MTRREPTDRMQDDKDLLALLRAAWKEGLASGGYAPLDLEEIKREGRKLLKQS